MVKILNEIPKKKNNICSIRSSKRPRDPGRFPGFPLIFPENRPILVYHIIH